MRESPECGKQENEGIRQPSRGPSSAFSKAFVSLQELAETKVFVSLQKLANEEKHAPNTIARPTEAVYRWCRHKEPREPRRRDSNSNRDDATRRANEWRWRKKSTKGGCVRHRGHNGQRVVVDVVLALHHRRRHLSPPSSDAVHVLVAAFPGRPTRPPASDFSPEFWGLVENRGTKRPKASIAPLLNKLQQGRNSSLKYIRSPHGQNTRAASRRPERRRKGARAPPSTLPDVPTPTQRMVESFTAKLCPPTSRCSKKRSARPMPSTKATWRGGKKNHPSWRMKTRRIPTSAAYLSFTKSLAAVLHGVRLREQNAEDIQLREAVYTKGRGVVMHQLQQTVTTLWSRWARVETLLGEGKYHPYHQSREYTMLEHYVQWLARTIFHLTYLNSSNSYLK
ncbi:hypothetical protein B0H14DRAFT_2642019 [Mycena olivaceomarginata]|nr:hypothetical protein B0H14DRAFT_2642019 [Mycena olivaceomarginata]